MTLSSDATGACSAQWRFVRVDPQAYCVDLFHSCVLLNTADFLIFRTSRSFKGSLPEHEPLC